MDDMPEELKPKWIESKKKYRFKNGAEIQLIGLDKNPNAGRGNYCDLYVFEEAGFIKNLSYIYSSIVVPMTMYRVGARVLMISTPPKTPDHDFKDFCIKAKHEGAYIELDIYKNPMVTPEMIEEYKAECLTETDWIREYLCRFATDLNSAIIPESEHLIVGIKRDTENYRYYHKYVAMDLGVRDLTACLFAYYDFKRAKLCIEREFVMSGPSMTTIKLRDAINEIEEPLWTFENERTRALERQEPYRRIADNNNPLLLQDLGSLHGLYFLPTTKEELHAMVNQVRIWISDGRIEVDESCKYLIDSVRYGIWNEQRKEFARSKTLGHYDALAALIYLVRSIDEITNPIPKKVGFNQIDLDAEETGFDTLKALIKF